MGRTEDLIQDYVADIDDAYRKWLKEAKEDLDFALNYQWSKEDTAKVKALGMNPLTLNKIRPIIELVSGYQRQNRMDIKCVGVEGGDDFVAEIMTLLIKNIMTRNYGEYKVSQMFQGGIMSSKGWIELSTNYEDDPMQAEIRLHNGMFHEIFPDPDYREYDMQRDAQFLIKKISLTKAKLTQMFPEKERLIKAANADVSVLPVIEDSRESETIYTRSERTQLIDLVECWYKKYEKKKFAVDFRSGEVKDITNLKLSVREQNEMLEVVDGLGIIEHRVGIPHMAVMVGDRLIQEETISPHYPELKGFPFVPYVSNYYPEGITPEKVCQGMVRALKDPQREINKRRMKLLDALGNSPWVGDEEALTPDGWDDLKKMASSPRLILKKKKKGADLQRVPSIISGMEYLHLIREDSQSLKVISGINPDLLGMQDKTLSGVAMVVRQQAGLRIIQHLFDNLRYSRHILGRSLISMILNTYTPDKIVRVCGKEKLAQAGGNPLQVAEKVLSNIDMKEYDIAVAETLLSPVMRMAVMGELMEMRAAGVIPPGIAEDLIVDASNLPNKEEIKARIMQFQQMQMQPIERVEEQLLAPSLSPEHLERGDVEVIS